MKILDFNNLSKDRVKDLMIEIDGDYLYNISASERLELCRNLNKAISKYPDLQAPPCWGDVIKNPGVWNSFAERRNNGEE